MKAISSSDWLPAPRPRCVLVDERVGRVGVMLDERPGRRAVLRVAGDVLGHLQVREHAERVEAALLPPVDVVIQARPGRRRPSAWARRRDPRGGSRARPGDRSAPRRARAPARFSAARLRARGRGRARRRSSARRVRPNSCRSSSTTCRRRSSASGARSSSSGGRRVCLSRSRSGESLHVGIGPVRPAGSSARRTRAAPGACRPASPRRGNARPRTPGGRDRTRGRSSWRRRRSLAGPVHRGPESVVVAVGLRPLGDVARPRQANRDARSRRASAGAACRSRPRRRGPSRPASSGGVRAAPSPWASQSTRRRSASTAIERTSSSGSQRAALAVLPAAAVEPDGALARAEPDHARLARGQRREVVVGQAVRPGPEAGGRAVEAPDALWRREPEPVLASRRRRRARRPAPSFACRRAETGAPTVLPWPASRRGRLRAPRPRVRPLPERSAAHRPPSPRAASSGEPSGQTRAAPHPAPSPRRRARGRRPRPGARHRRGGRRRGRARCASRTGACQCGPGGTAPLRAGLVPRARPRPR